MERQNESGKACLKPPSECALVGADNRMKAVCGRCVSWNAAAIYGAVRRALRTFAQQKADGIGMAWGKTPTILQPARWMRLRMKCLFL